MYKIKVNCGAPKRIIIFNYSVTAFRYNFLQIFVIYFFLRRNICEPELGIAEQYNNKFFAG